MPSGFVNVGIRLNQKDEIDKIRREKIGKYSSINQFVQTAVEQLIIKEKYKESVGAGEEDVDATLYKIEEFVKKILEDELDDKITISSSVAGETQDILVKIKQFHISLKWEDETKRLISAIHIKDSLNSLKRAMEESNKLRPLKMNIPQKYINMAEELKDRFVNAIKSLRGKPEK